MRTEFCDGDEDRSGEGWTDWMMRVICIGVGAGALALFAVTLLAAFDML